MSQARLFREEWVERQRAGARPGELVRHARWMRRATLILVASVAACVVAASRVSVAQSLQLPAVVTGQTAVASLTGAGAPARWSVSGWCTTRTAPAGRCTGEWS